MTRVGIRQFRTELRRWIDRAAKGKVVLITDRGRPIAKLTSATAESALDELIRKGIVTPARVPKQPSSAFRPVRARGSVSEIVIEQRR
jgi:prevent-host-death family protein